VYVVKLPNLDPVINQNKATKKFENHLLSIKAEHQNRIRPNLHPTYNERHQKIIELIDWALDKYGIAGITDIKNNQQNEETIIIDNIIEKLDKKKRYSYNEQEKGYTNR
jgi:hypothetical protein